MKIKKAVFPVAGFGTRFLPATKANPKEMLPIVDKPLIQYAVEEAIAAGIEELIFVTSNSKRAIEDHFDRNFELETHLAQHDKQALLSLVQNLIPDGVTCSYVRQSQQLGLGHAVLCAAPLINQQPFAVLLADDLIINENGKNCLQQMMESFSSDISASIAVEKIHPQDSTKYGIVQVQSSPSENIHHINHIVEKPLPDDAPSDLGVVGRYLFQADILSHLKHLTLGKGAEIQLTDGIERMLKAGGNVDAFVFKGERFDCGSKLGYLCATTVLGMRHKTEGEAFRAFLNGLLRDF